jgi:alkylated DNA repair protein alkB family protein 8
VHTSAHATGIPGLQLLHDFITSDQEQALLAAVDAGPWQALAKRRVQHYGFDFKYDRRGVDAGQTPQELPGWVQPVLEQIQVGV